MIVFLNLQTTVYISLNHFIVHQVNAEFRKDFSIYIDNTNPKITVTYTDGSEKIYNDRWELYNNTGYDISYSDNQYEDHWSVGFHTVTAEFMGKTCEFQVEIKTSPVESFTLMATDKLIENTDGNYNTDSDGVEYFDYNVSHTNPIITVTYTDGTEKTYSSDGDLYNETGYWISYNTNQYVEHWTVGTRTATAEFMGKSCELQVEVTESPVKSFTVTAIDKLIENTDGNYNTDSDGVEYFDYDIDYTNPVITVTYTDGSEKIYNDRWDLYNETGYDISYSDNQYKDHWSVGFHTVTAEFMGKTCEFQVEIVKDPIDRIEITVGKALVEHKDGYWTEDENGIEFYWYTIENADLKYTVKYKTGNCVTFNSSDNLYKATGKRISIYDNQYEEHLYPGIHTITAQLGNNEYAFEIEIIENTAGDFEYFIQDGNAYITDCYIAGDIVDIPSEIDGYPVFGLTGFSSTGRKITKLNIPDSVRFISSDFFYAFQNLEELTVGASLSKLENRWFSSCSELTSITVSEENENYCSIDGKVYTKDGQTLVVYPLGSGDIYNVPDSVKNIDVIRADGYLHINCIFSENNPQFITEDGVTYSADRKTIISCSPDKSGDYQMPESVTKIADYAFQDCNKLTALKFSENVTDIAYAAFYGCGSLTYIDIPESVKSIGLSSFSGCSALESITLPENLKTVGGYAFSECNNLKKVYITDLAAWCGIDFAGEDSNPASYSGALYLNDELITELIIPSGVSSIGDYAFSSNSSITSVNIPSSVKAVGASAFLGCDNLEKVNINDLAAWCGIDFVGEDANPSSISGVLYLNNKLVTELIIPDGVSSIGDYAFSSNSSITSVNISSSIKVVGVSEFSGCDNLEKVNITDLAAWCGIDFADEDANPSSISGVLYLNDELITDLFIPYNVSKIGDFAFYNNSKLESITFIGTVEAIGEYAFFNNGILKNVTFISSVGNVGQYAFYECGNIEKVYITNLEQWCETDFANKEANPLYYAGKLYHNSNHIINLTIPDGVRRIGDFAFAGADITDITLPDTVVEIGDGAFFETDVSEFPTINSINTIPNYAFVGTNITSVDLPDTVTEIGYAAFLGCAELSEISIPDTILRVKGQAFDNTEWYNSQTYGAAYIDSVFYKYFTNEYEPQSILTVKDGTRVIADYAVSDPYLTEVVLPDSVITIGKGAFDGSGNLKEIVLPDSLRYIYGSAFYGTAIEKIEIPASVEYIDTGAFFECDSLTEINVAPDNPYYSSQDGILYNKDKTELLYCPEGKAGVIRIPDGVTKISEYAFRREYYSVNKINIIIIPSSVTEIEYIPSGTFIQCTKGSAAEEFAKQYNMDYYAQSISEIPGDINGDGSVDVKDFVKLKKMSASGDYSHSADLLPDGKINSLDLAEMHKYLLGVNTYS